MNAVNRVIVVLLLVLVAAGCVLFVAQPSVALVGAGQAIAYLRALIEGGYYAVLAVVCAILLVLALVVIFFELRRGRRVTVRVSRSGGTSVELSTESVARSVEYYVAQVTGIRQVRPRVVSTGSAVRVELDLEMDPATGIPEKSEEVVAQAREVVEGRLGLKIAGLTVRLRQGAYTKDAVGGGPGSDLPEAGIGVTS
ncbi:MAG: alkaline shock response membrane anchor protein AmaP [Anaerolineae bacterium]